MRSGLPVSFADLVLHHALTQPEKPAIVLADRVVTYGMVAQGILRVERRIRALALKPGALVCVTVSNPIRHLIVAAALFRSGHPMMSATRTNEILALGLPVAAFLESPGAPLVPGQRHVTVTDEWFEGEAELFSASPPKGHPDDQAICRVDLSSGTTGRPKGGVVHVGGIQQLGEQLLPDDQPGFLGPAAMPAGTDQQLGLHAGRARAVGGQDAVFRRYAARLAADDRALRHRHAGRIEPAIARAGARADRGADPLSLAARRDDRRKPGLPVADRRRARENLQRHREPVRIDRSGRHRVRHRGPARRRRGGDRLCRAVGER